MRRFECFLKPGPGERTEAAVPLPESDEAVIAGTVTGPGGPEDGALVLLLDQERGELLAHTVTDSQGRFYLGPLAGGRLYSLRVQKNDCLVRVVELEG